MNSLRRRFGGLLRPVVAHINVSTKASVSAKIQWRAYFSFRSSPMGFRIRESKISCPSVSPSTRHRFSSSSSLLKSGTGFVGWYLRKLDTYPFITKSISSSLIYVAADLTSQVEDGFYVCLQVISAFFQNYFEFMVQFVNYIHAMKKRDRVSDNITRRRCHLSRR